MPDITVCVPDVEVEIDGNNFFADEDAVTKALQNIVDNRLDDIEEIAQEIYENRREDDFKEPEDEGPMSSRDEDKALDAYEKSHGW